MENKIRNLIIDLGVVLIDLDPQRCYNKFKSYGVTNIERLVGASYKNGLFHELEKGTISTDTFVKELCKLIGKPLTAEQINNAWNSFLQDIPAYKLDLLLHLREKYMVYLLSNTNTIHWEWIRQHCFEYKGFEAKDFFDKMYLSFEMHQTKPDKEIFRTVLADANLKPEETFLIDDADENCRTAETLGIRTYTPGIKEDWSHLFNEENNGNNQRYK